MTVKEYVGLVRFFRDQSKSASGDVGTIHINFRIPHGFDGMEILIYDFQNVDKWAEELGVKARLEEAEDSFTRYGFVYDGITVFTYPSEEELEEIKNENNS